MTLEYMAHTKKSHCLLVAPSFLMGILALMAIGAHGLGDETVDGREVGSGSTNAPRRGSKGPRASEPSGKKNGAEETSWVEEFNHLQESQRALLIPSS